MLYPRSFQQCSVLLAAASDAVSKSCRDRRRPCWKLRSSCGSQPIALTAADPRTYTHTANQLLERLGYAPSCRIRTLTSPIPRSSLTTRAQANKIEGYTRAAVRIPSHAAPAAPRPDRRLHARGSSMCFATCIAYAPARLLNAEKRGEHACWSLHN